jgi:hypothetical protein
VEEAAYDGGGSSCSGVLGEKLRLRGEAVAVLCEPGLVGAASGESIVEVG